MNDVISIKTLEGIGELFQENATLLQNVKHSIRDNKRLLDFDEPIAFDDIQPIADALRNIGFTEFTISARQENLIEVLAEFQKLGVKVNGIEEFAAHREFIDGKERSWCFDAILMKIEPVKQSTTQKIRDMWCEGYDKILEAADAAEEAINAKEYNNEFELEDVKTSLETCEAIIRLVEGD